MSCNPLGKPRNVDWENEWKENSIKLKELLLQIDTDADNNFHNGNNEFPKSFKYPFDEGFHLKKTDSFLTVKFYIDRGLLDHYSAFIYSNDPYQTGQLDANVENEGNDYKLEDKWYIIND